MTTRSSRGMSTDTSRRLCSRAPTTRMALAGRGRRRRHRWSVVRTPARRAVPTRRLARGTTDAPRRLAPCTYGPARRAPTVVAVLSPLRPTSSPPFQTGGGAADSDNRVIRRDLGGAPVGDPTQGPRCPHDPAFPRPVPSFLARALCGRRGAGVGPDARCVGAASAAEPVAQVPANVVAAARRGQTAAVVVPYRAAGRGGRRPQPERGRRGHLQLLGGGDRPQRPRHRGADPPAQGRPRLRPADGRSATARSTARAPPRRLRPRRAPARGRRRPCSSPAAAASASGSALGGLMRFLIAPARRRPGGRARDRQHGR